MNINCLDLQATIMVTTAASSCQSFIYNHMGSEHTCGNFTYSHITLLASSISIMICGH